MKKILFILIMFIPIFVFAEDVYYGVTDSVYLEAFSNRNQYYYSDEIVYENGMYRLTGNVKNISIDNSHGYFNDDVKEFYTCKSRDETECEEVFVVYKDSGNFTSPYGSGLLGVKLQNGLKKEDIEYYYIGEDYKYENGKYTLVNYQKYEIRTINVVTYLSVNYKGKFFCLDNFGITCDKLIVFDDVSNYYSYGTSVENYYLISDNYIKEKGKYRLVNPRRVWGANSGGEHGYTCRSKEDTCDELYNVLISPHYDIHDGGRLNSFTLLSVLGETKDVELKLGETYNPLDFFNEDELDNMVNTNPDVADIKNKKLELYKVGETYFIVEDDFNYKALHLSVTEDMIPKEEPKNPNTKDMVLMVIVLMVIVLLYLSGMCFIIFSNKKYNY